MINTSPLAPAGRLVRGSSWAQAGLLIVLWACMDRVGAALHLPLPASVTGLLALLLALESRVLPASLVERGADGLLRHLMLFFVPAMLGLVDHRELLSLLGLKLLLAVLLGTLLVMAGTALVVEAGLRVGARRAGRA